MRNTAVEAQQYEVGVEIVSSSDTLAGISRRLGLACDRGSLTRRATKHRKYWKGKVVWRRRSAAVARTALDQKIRRVVKLFSDGLDSLLPRCECTLTILVYYRGAYGSIVVRPQTLELLARKGLSLEVTAFPCST